MNFSNKAIWIVGSIGAAAVVCCIALGIALRSESKVENRQQADIKALSNVHNADNSAQIVNDAAKKKADEDAQKKASIIDRIPADIHGADLVRELQRGLRGESADPGADSAGKPAGTVPASDHAAGTDANVRP